ncbi:hypothetical protein ScPMuIL_011009 [Solemya velum]
MLKDMMIRCVLLVCVFALSSAYVDDLTDQLNELGCTPKSLDIDEESTIAMKISNICNFPYYIADCIETKIAERSPIAQNYFNGTFNFDMVMTKFEQLCARLANDNELSMGLYCLENITPASCFSDWKVRGKVTVCEKTQDYRNCVRETLQYCPASVRDFMGDYVTVLWGSPDNCGSVLSDKSEYGESSSMQDPAGIMGLIFNMNSSAIMECGNDLIRAMTNSINITKWSTNIMGTSGPNINEIMEIMDDSLDIFCREKTNLMTCLKAKMPSSSSPIDMIALLLIDLDSADKVLNNYCENRTVITGNLECLSSQAISEASTQCLKPMLSMNMDNITRLGFGMLDYICSAVVNITECLGEKLTVTCNKEVADFMTSSYTGMLTPYCRNARPRPVVDVMQPGWSYTVIPGGMVGMECILPTSAKMIKEFNTNSGPDNSAPNFQAIVQKAMDIVCNDAESILDCLDAKLRHGQSPIDELTRQVIDLSKLRTMVTTTCLKKAEIVSGFPCFFEQSLQTTQQTCFNSLTNEFLKNAGSGQGDLSPFFMLDPKMRSQIKSFICDGGYKQFALCEADAVKSCDATLATHVIDVMVGPIRDTCLTDDIDDDDDDGGNDGGDDDDDDDDDEDGDENKDKNKDGDDDCVEPTCSACSAVLNGLLWLLIGVVTLLWF